MRSPTKKQTTPNATDHNLKWVNSKAFRPSMSKPISSIETYIRRQRPDLYIHYTHPPTTIRHHTLSFPSINALSNTTIFIFTMKFQENQQQLFQLYHQNTISELQQELRRLKDKEKHYLKLNLKVKDLQQKSRRIKKVSEQLANEEDENLHIQQLKRDIDRTLIDIKKIDDDNKLIKEQTKSLQNQLKGLEQIYATFCLQNKGKRQRIQLKDEALVQKQNQLQQLMQKRSCNDLIVEQLRMQICKLQGEEQQLKNQIETMRVQRQQQQNEKQRLRVLVMQLKRQINEQEYHSQQFKFKISQVKEASYLLKEELITLIKMQQHLRQELQRTSSHYHHMIDVQSQSTKKVALLKDQLQVVEGDVKRLTQEYIRQSDILRGQQRVNVGLNQQIDVIAKEAFEVWSNIKEIIWINQDKTEIKTKAYRIWMDISHLLSLE